MNAALLQSVAHASTASNAPISVRGLGKSFGASRVFTNVGFDVPAGAVLGLIGRNGSGKSTLLRCLLGLIEADAGEAFLLGEHALKLSDSAKERIGYVPQLPDAMGSMLVGPMLDFVGRFYPRWDEGFVLRMLSRWDIPRSRELKSLSPGERQRVALIRALALRPEVLVLDEPAASLDPAARRDLLREIIERASDEGTTIVISSHIVSDLERVASHVAFLNEGSLLLFAPIDDLKERCVRFVLPADVAATLPKSALPGELARHAMHDGGVRLVVLREEGQAWPAPTQDARVLQDVPGLEDLFVEVVE